MNRGKSYEEKGTAFMLGVDINTVNAGYTGQCHIGISSIAGNGSAGENRRGCLSKYRGYGTE